MIRNYPVHPVVTITIAAAVTVRDLRGRAVVLVLPDPEAVPVPLVQWDLRAPRVNPDFKATQVLSDLLEPLALPDLSELPEPLALPDLPELSDLLALPGLSDLQSRLFMHNIRFSFVLNRQAVRLPCSQSPG